METATQYTCRITLVNPGLSDSVIKVWPAEHESEKIWLNEVRGIERWEMIQRNINVYAERGTRVPKPEPYHKDPKNLVHMTLQEQDIPLVRLDGWVLPAPPPPENIPIYKNNTNNMLEVDKRLNQLENTLGSLAQALSSLTTLKEPPKPTQNSNEKATAAVPSSFECCGKNFKEEWRLKSHRTKMHKENETVRNLKELLKTETKK